MVTDADRVMARGAEVVLGDGNTYRIKFDLEGLEHLEDSYGGIADFLDAYRDVLNLGFGAKRVKFIRSAAEAGLLHLGIPPEQTKVLVTPKHLRAPSLLMIAIGAALDEALVPPEEGAEGKDSAEESDSTGAGSTTSAPSDSGVLTPSGAA